MSNEPAVVQLNVTLTVPADGVPSFSRMSPEDYALYMVQGALNNTLHGCNAQVTKTPTDNQSNDSKGTYHR